MVILIVNLTGFTIAMETYLWVYLQGQFQKGLTEEPPCLPGASVNAMQRLVEQLKLAAAMERIKVSQAAAELQQYCMQNACKDALLLCVLAGSNPFREPQSCALL
ncbi:guanine nucleotide-binding protein G(I)/G(S)/G(O) subunit gamma-10-like [Onychomys torridus]|uniref:guanine nucleotide-binding protein G(I)/G(S)/G(O) subunit gamma-10-like n=1 Tax=Onychomys torridus TaxID=38674 RepID=UPI00167FA334|nr:guanine nucleotide-binding protein G(I)/G(S)/G(O) subunit gamma-10-like [Onychomys torridus]